MPSSKTLADPGKAYFPNSIPTLMQIRSECASPTIRQLMPSSKTLADPGKAYLPNPIPTLMQIRSEYASPTIRQIMPSSKTLADPGKAYLPTPILPNNSEHPQRFISPTQLIISISLSTNTWAEIRSEYDYLIHVESPNLAFRGSVYLPAPNYPISFR